MVINLMGLQPLNLIEVVYSLDGYLFSQLKFINNVFHCAGFSDEKMTNTPLELNAKYYPTIGELLLDPTRYHKIVGSLVCLIVT